MSGTSAGWATAKENWAALHCSIDIVCDTVLKLVISEISVWATAHQAHSTDPPLNFSE
jgi:hypothetical protein